METNSTEIKQKLSFKYYCEICDYGTCKKSNFNNHCESNKHIFNVLETNSTAIKPILSAKKYNCDICNKNYTDRSGLWKHKKICIKKEEKEKEKEKEENEENEENDDITELTDKAIIKALLQQTEKMMKMMENGINNNHSHNTNSNNKTFNLNFFLNETCKDAMNISEFVSFIKINLDDLENTGRQGYVKGITNIVLKNLNKLEKHMRPLHCVDVKREVMYIKDNNEWTKETQDNPILTKAIKTIANQNIKLIKNWRDSHSDCTKSDSNKNNLYLKIVSNSMNGLTKEEGDQNMNKIISNIAKDVIIDKHN